jgi:hypothetical protein
VPHRGRLGPFDGMAALSEELRALKALCPDGNSRISGRTREIWPRSFHGGVRHSVAGAAGRHTSPGPQGRRHTIANDAVSSVRQANSEGSESAASQSHGDDQMEPGPALLPYRLFLGAASRRTDGKGTALSGTSSPQAVGLQDDVATEFRARKTSSCGSEQSAAAVSIIAGRARQGSVVRPSKPANLRNHYPCQVMRSLIAGT